MATDGAEQVGRKIRREVNAPSYFHARELRRRDACSQAPRRAGEGAADQFIAVVKNSLTDGEVCDWVRQNVKKTDAEKAALRDYILNRGKDTDELRQRLKLRKEEAGLSRRDDIQSFVDFIDADEKRI